METQTIETEITVSASNFKRIVDDIRCITGDYGEVSLIKGVLSYAGREIGMLRLLKAYRGSDKQGKVHLGKNEATGKHVFSLDTPTLGGYWRMHEDETEPVTW